MKRFSNLLPGLCLLLLFTTVAAPELAAADGAEVRATLILGTNEGDGVDESLRRFERNLKRVLRFDTFQHQGSGSAAIPAPGSANIRIGNGHVVSVTLDEAGDGKLRMAAKWTGGGRTLINTTVVTARDQPTVLVGPSSGDGKLILLLIAH